MCLQLVAIYCQGMIPGLLPLVWSIVIMKVRCMLLSSSTYISIHPIHAPEPAQCSVLCAPVDLPLAPSSVLAPVLQVQLTFAVLDCRPCRLRTSWAGRPGSPSACLLQMSA